jgi:hypothetical protein
VACERQACYRQETSSDWLAETQEIQATKKRSINSRGGGALERSRACGYAPCCPASYEPNRSTMPRY